MSNKTICDLVDETRFYFNSPKYFLATNTIFTNQNFHSILKRLKSKLTTTIMILFAEERKVFRIASISIADASSLITFFKFYVVFPSFFNLQCKTLVTYMFT